jgi:hypothetical protein
MKGKKEEKKGIFLKYAVIRATTTGSIPHCTFSARKQPIWVGSNYDLRVCELGLRRTKQ